MTYEVNITTNRSAWKNALSKASLNAEKALGEQMLSDSLNYIPKQEGSLRDSGRLETDNEGAFLSWKGVYAAYQWYGMRADGTHVVHNYTTPGTGKMWVDAAGQANKSKWQQVAQNAFDRGLT